jgi:predicted Fe-Mo cluster-binding NifX family protein
MLIALSASSPDLEGSVDPHFGRCPFILIVDSDRLTFEALANPHLAASGAGIQTAQLVVSKGAKAVLTGNCGPNASRVLDAAGVRVLTGVSGAVRDALQGFRSGEGAFPESGPSTVSPPFGGGGEGKGRGRGMGLGRGRGLWPAGEGRGVDLASSAPEPDLNELKEQARRLEESLERIKARIANVEKDSSGKA